MSETWGIKISKPGDDALRTPTDELVASSKYPTPKVKVGQASPHTDTGSIVIPSGSSGEYEVVNIPHTYGYTCTSFTIVDLETPSGSGDYRTPPVPWIGGAGVDAFTDDERYKIVVTDSENAIGYRIRYKYYIFDRSGT